MKGNPPAAPCGVLILDKPSGLTSHDAVDRVRRLFGTRAVGHTGTLDPMATGVLVMLIGRTTKAAELIAADEKRYAAQMLLGVTTDTLDTTGAVLTRCDDVPSESDVSAAVERFTGSYGQVPPMYSAIKKDGAKMVDLARRGITVELDPRPVTVHSIGLKKISEREYSLDVRCSAGTYIRSLCRDIGEALGCGAAMSALRRVSCGRFSLDGAYTLERLEAMEYGVRVGTLISTESLFADCPALKLPAFFAGLAHNGQPVYLHKIGADVPDGTLVRLCDDNGFFAVARVMQCDDGPAAKPVKQFVVPTV